jgi:hypothetical protein
VADRPAALRYGKDALSSAASCLKGFYLEQAVLGVNAELGRQFDLARLPSRADRDRALLGHAEVSLPTNPLAPRWARRRHPKMLPDYARSRLLEEASTARDRLVVTCLADGGSGSGSCAACTWPIFTCGSRPRAVKSGRSTPTSATGRRIPTRHGPSRSTRGMPGTAS